MQIEIDAQGMPNFTLEKGDSFLANGTERIGFGDNSGAAKPFVNFYPKTVPMPAASLAAGRPIFKSVVFMRLQHPGERDNIDRPATRDDALRFPVQYRQYCEGRQGVPDGIPLDVLFPNHQDVREGLNFHKVYTVEQLAVLTDTQLQNIGFGGYEWQQKAKRYLAALDEGKGFAQHEETIRKLQVEMDRTSQTNGDLARQVQRLTDQLAAVLQGQNPLVGQAPGQAAMPMHLQQQAPAPVIQHDGMFLKPAPGELGADDITHMSRPPAETAALDPAPNTAFLNEASQAAAPASEPASRRRR